MVRADSNHSSISCDDRDAVSPTPIGPILCRARAIVDYTPSPYDKDALNFKVMNVLLLHNRASNYSKCRSKKFKTLPINNKTR